MHEIKKVAGYNLIIMLLYSLIIRFTASEGDRGLTVLVLSAVAIVIQVVINLILAIIFFVQRKKQLGKNFLLSAGIVLLIGFSSCLGNASIG